MSEQPAQIILITGIMASGKSTVAQRLAERLPKSVHLHGDYFRTMIVNGRADMSPPPSEEAMRQLWLRYGFAIDTADAYASAGFDVVVQDVILGADFRQFVERLGSKGKPLYVVVLAPRAEVVAQREAERGKKGYHEWTPDDLDQALRTDTARIGLWLDSSDLSVDETVDQILAQLDAAAVRS